MILGSGFCKKDGANRLANPQAEINGSIHPLGKYTSSIITFLTRCISRDTIKYRKRFGILPLLGIPESRKSENYPIPF